MNKIILKFRNTFFTKQFFIFITIGIINTFIGVIFSYVFSNFFNENIAFIIGYTCGLFISYILNSFFTFKENLNLKKFIKLSISYIPNFIIQNIVVLIIFNILNLHKLIAYVLAAIIGVPLTFILMKFFAFKHKEQ